MRFFHISKGKAKTKFTDQFLEDACKDLDVTYVKLPDTHVSNEQLVELRDITENDVVYRSSRSPQAHSIEKYLANFNPKNIYLDRNTVYSGRGSSYHLMKKEGLPVIPSVPILPNKKREAQATAELLGGFPVVLKVLGGMEGVGVIRLDSAESFNSVVDYLRKDANAHMLLMKYIPHRFYGRLVVIGDRVIVSTREAAPVGDFRANARGFREQKVETYEFPDLVKEEAVAAVKASGSRVGGVDALFADDTGEVYFAEVNAPFNFAETQKNTGVDIARELVQQLVNS